MYYPFIEPSIMPRLKYFCANGNTIAIGKTEITIAQYLTASAR